MIRSILSSAVLALSLVSTAAAQELSDELLKKLEQLSPKEYLAENGALLPNGSHVDGDMALALIAGGDYALEIRIRDGQNGAEPFMQLVEMDAATRERLAPDAQTLEPVDMLGQAWPFPRFSTLDGKTFDLEADDAPEVTIVDFWFTVCSPCVQAMPELNAIQARYADHPVAFIAPTFEERRAVRRFLNRHEFNFSVKPRARRWFEDVIGQIRAPTYLWINSDNIIEAQLHSPAEIEQRLAQHFAEDG